MRALFVRIGFVFTEEFVQKFDVYCVSFNNITVMPVASLLARSLRDQLEHGEVMEELLQILVDTFSDALLVAAVVKTPHRAGPKLAIHFTYDSIATSVCVTG